MNGDLGLEVQFFPMPPCFPAVASYFFSFFDFGNVLLLCMYINYSSRSGKHVFPFPLLVMLDLTDI